MTRYPGRSTGIGERPPLPNVLPVPASLGTPITEPTAVVNVATYICIFLILGGLNDHGICIFLAYSIFFSLLS